MYRMFLSYFLIVMSISSINGFSNGCSKANKGPMFVLTMLDIENIADVDEVGKTITLDLSLYVMWLEPDYVPSRQKNKYTLQ